MQLRLGALDEAQFKELLDVQPLRLYPVLGHNGDPIKHTGRNENESRTVCKRLLVRFEVYLKPRKRALFIFKAPLKNENSGPPNFLTLSRRHPRRWRSPRAARAARWRRA